MVPKINVYLPDDLAAEVKAAGIPVSAVCQQALADAVAQGEARRPARAPADDGPVAELHEDGRTACWRTPRRRRRQPTTVDLWRLCSTRAASRWSVLDGRRRRPRGRRRRAAGHGQGGPATAGPLEDVAERAVDQARSLGHSYVGTEHLLLGLTSGPPRELAAVTLRDMGVTHETALRGVATALSAYSYARETLTFSGLSAPIRAALEDIRSRLARLEERRVS